MHTKLIILSLFFISCKSHVIKEDLSLNEAKWYFYSYACDLTGYIQRNKVIDPIECDIQTKVVVKINKDTTEVFFNLYYKDTLNVCWLKPFSLAGIKIVNNTLFIPIYHQTILANNSDSAILKEMYKQSLLLQKKILESNNSICTLLQAEVRRKKL